MPSRVLSVLLPLFLVGASAGPDPSYCLDQEATRYAKQRFALRAEPSTSADSLANVALGVALVIDKCESDWCSARMLLGGEWLRGFAPENLLVKSPPTSSEQTQTRTCCKICKKGKACGNSCISRSKTCHKAPGCACNG